MRGFSKKYLTVNVDEIYASVNALSDGCMAKVIDFADNNLKVLKFLPDNKEIFGKKLGLFILWIPPHIIAKKNPNR